MHKSDNSDKSDQIKNQYIFSVFKGVVPTVLTPFNKKLEIDYLSLCRLMDDYAANNVQGILVPVVASEVDKLTSAEKTEIICASVEAAKGRFPVIGGILASSPKEAGTMGEAAVSSGCFGLVCRAPSSISQTRDESLLIEYFKAAASNCSFFVVQDLAFDDFGMPLVLIEKLFSLIPSFKAIKVEVVRTGYKTSKILEMTGNKLDVWSGWAALQMIEGLDRGIKVFNISAYNRVFAEICRLYFADRREDAVKLFERILPYLAFSRQHIDINLQLIKQYLVCRGIFETSLMREPCLEYDSYHQRYGDEIISRMIEWENTLSSNPALS